MTITKLQALFRGRKVRQENRKIKDSMNYAI